MIISGGQAEQERGSSMGNKIFKTANLRKTVNYLKKNGLRHTWYAAKERIGEEKKSFYVYREPSGEELAAQQAGTMDYSELFSIIVPAYETKETFLRELIDSVRRQSYQNWELIIADAGSSDGVEKAVAQILEETGERRIKYSRLAENKGISCNTNEGIVQASGDYIALLDHDDWLTPDALYHMASAVHRSRQRGIAPVLLYSDEDKYDNNEGYFFAPNIKEKFNFDLILSNNYICHFMAVEAAVMKNLLLRQEYDGAQDYDLVLRVVGGLCEQMPKSQIETSIIHIPRVLYHWRCHVDSTAENTASKSYAYEAGRAALADFCKGQGWPAEVEHSLHLGFYEINYQPDILTVREDVGILGGRILDRHKCICGGAMDDTGRCLYAGLHREYSGGSTHRAVLKQDAAAVDVRCMRIRPELRDVFEQITGLAYREKLVRCERGSGYGRKGREGNGTESAEPENARGRIRIADVSGLTCDEAGYRKISMELGRAAAEMGYLVLWDPQMTIRI